MAKLLTTEQFVTRARDVHGDKYDYSSTKYVANRSNVTIICPSHGPFDQRPGNHLTGNGCPACSGKKRVTTTDFIAKAREVHGDRYDYSLAKYTGRHSKLCIICHDHGQFTQTSNNHLGGQGCPICGGTVRSTTSEFVTKAQQKHGDKYDYSKTQYITNKIPVEIICPIHGTFFQRPMTHLVGGGCELCSSTALQTTAQFIQRAALVHGNLYDYSLVEYAGALQKVDIVCKIHGIFSQQSNSHLRGAGCPACRSKTFSQKCIRWLNQIAEEENVRIQHAETGGEYRIPGTRMKVDGYCKETNTIYEFHGDAYHGNPLRYHADGICHPFDRRTTAAQLYQRTLDREKKIRSLGYNLVVMWESEFDEYFMR